MTQRHVARRRPVHAGPAAWNAILPPAPTYPPLEGDHTADVVIVGGGFAGLSAARRLTQLMPQGRIALLEATHIADGAAGRNSGFMIDLPHELASNDYAGPGDDRALITLNRQAIGFARETVNEFGIKADFFDPAGKINGAAHQGADDLNRQYAAHLADLNEPYEMLDAQAMQDLTGSGHYLSGLYTPGTVMLQPAGYVRGLAAGLARDIALYERSPALALTRLGSDWQVQTPQGAITAPQVILATNGHLESFGFATGRLMHLFLFASMTEELGEEARHRLGGQDRWGITPSDPMGTTMRRIDTGQGGHRIITRTCAVLRSGMESRPRDLARAARMHRQKFDQRFPQLSGLRMEHSWSGHLCLSRNGVSVTGPLEPGLISACVQNGLGTARGTLTGMAAAEHALGLTSDITAHFAAEGAPTRLPPQPLRDLGANAYLRYKEWRAAAE